MKWLIVIFMLFHATAFSKSHDVFFNNVPALSESVLEQQRGGFFSSGKHFSIGLKMSVLVNGNKVFNSHFINMVNGVANQEIANIPSAEGLSVTPLLGQGKIGFIIKNSGSGIRTDTMVDINATIPYSLNTYKSNQQISSRVRAATQRMGY